MLSSVPPGDVGWVGGAGEAQPWAQLVIAGQHTEICTFGIVLLEI